MTLIRIRGANYAHMIRSARHRPVWPWAPTLLALVVMAAVLFGSHG